MVYAAIFAIPVLHTTYTALLLHYVSCTLRTAHICTVMMLLDFILPLLFACCQAQSQLQLGQTDPAAPNDLAEGFRRVLVYARIGLVPWHY